MKLICPNLNCKSNVPLSPITPQIVLNGHCYRKSDSRKIRRFHCKLCGKYFSRATFSPAYRQKKRRINYPLFQLYGSGVSARRAAILLKVNRKTVARRFQFLAKQAMIRQQEFLTKYKKNPLSEIQFDDLETSEHTKFKPLSVSLAVDPIRRKILSFKVSQMPAKGLLAKKAFYKYGPRKDMRHEGWDSMMRELVPYVKPEATWTSDQNPHYPKYLFKHHPKATHIQVKGGRGCVVGQGELKKLHFDPLFALNHTCAMLRANMNRLFRRTWCTTKKIEGLENHLAIFVCYFNHKLTEQSDLKGAS